MHSVLALKPRTGEMAPEQAETVRRSFGFDVTKHRFRVAALRVRHYESAELLLGHHGAARGLRALDSFQLASAMDLLEKGLIDSFITSERVLCVAPLEGLAVIDPEALPG